MVSLGSCSKNKTHTGVEDLRSGLVWVKSLATLIIVKSSNKLQIVQFCDNPNAGASRVVVA